MDNLFLLEDNTLASVDYKLEDKEYNRIKCISYIVRILDRYYYDEKNDIQLIVVYTGDGETSKNVLEVNCFTLGREQVEKVKEELIEKLQNAN